MQIVKSQQDRKLVIEEETLIPTEDNVLVNVCLDDLVTLLPNACDVNISIDILRICCSIYINNTSLFTIENLYYMEGMEDYVYDFIFEYLKEEYPNRPEYVETFKNMLKDSDISIVDLFVRIMNTFHRQEMHDRLIVVKWLKDVKNHRLSVIGIPAGGYIDI